jgi:hypothetical protein
MSLNANAVVAFRIQQPAVFAGQTGIDDIKEQIEQYQNIERLSSAAMAS